MKSVDIPFIKTTKQPPIILTSKQKVLLNRRGNELFNEGKLTEAQQIFKTTGYSDGLTRVGDYYATKNQHLEALKFYCLAKNTRKYKPMIESLVSAMKILISDSP